MKALNFQKLNLQNVDFLTKTQMKNILGGYGGSGGDIGCQTSCSGDTWNPKTFKLEHGTSPCYYTPPIGGLPGSCDCPYSTNATSCS